MLDLSSYERRLNANSRGMAMSNSTIDTVNATFDSNPSFVRVFHNGVEVDCLYKLHKYMSNTIYLTFRPLYTVHKGDYIEFEGKTYIVSEFIDNEIYPKAEITFCNNTLRWKDSFGTVFEFPCTVNGSALVLDDAKYSNNNRFVLRSDSNIFIKIQYNEYTKMIIPTQRFVINKKVYDATTINDLDVYEEKGYLELTLTSTAKSTTDDLDNGIADSSGDSGWDRGGWE